MPDGGIGFACELRDLLTNKKKRFIFDVIDNLVIYVDSWIVEMPMRDSVRKVAECRQNKRSSARESGVRH